MRAEHLMEVVGALVLLMGWGNVSPARSELRAVVEDSTTIVVMRGDSVVFRKEMEFAREISSEVIAKQLGSGSVALVFSYVPGDTTTTNPLIGSPKDDETRGHLVVIDGEGHIIFSADGRWYGLHRGEVVMQSPDTLMVLFPDEGVVVTVGVSTGIAAANRFSEWGCRGGFEEPAPFGWLVPFPTNRAVIVRTDPNLCGDGIRSEVLMIGRAGEVLWKLEEPGVYRAERSWFLVDEVNKLLIGQRALTGGSWRYQLQAVSETGNPIWERDLGSWIARRMELTGGVLQVWLHRGRDGGQRLIELDPMTGESR